MSRGERIDMRVVISQSMYFPWVGLLEQLRLADVFVHYDDVQFTRGFYNRVQVKTANGPTWLTVPLRGHHRGQAIDEVLVDGDAWRRHHIDVLRQSYFRAPYFQEVLEVVASVHARPVRALADVSRASILALAKYFGLGSGKRFLDSRSLHIGGTSSRRLLDITLAVGGNVYVSGHGARNYLDHELFERAGVAVEYMAYRYEPYPQLNGAFTPYVTALDLAANCGAAGASFICSGTIPWRRFIEESA
jgi:hypothetical protein